MQVLDRIDKALRDIIVAVFEEKLFGLYEYSVKSFDESSQTVSAAPISSSRLPLIARVKIRTPNMRLKLESGSSIVVAFAGGDPANPFVVAFDNAAVFTTAIPAARQGDAVQVGMILVQAIGPAGPIPGAYSIVLDPKNLPPPPFEVAGGPVNFPGFISSGSLFCKQR